MARDFDDEDLAAVAGGPHEGSAGERTLADDDVREARRLFDEALRRQNKRLTGDDHLP